MTLYMLFAAAGILIYAGTTFIAAVTGVSDIHVAIGLQVAWIATVSCAKWRFLGQTADRSGPEAA